MRAVINLPFTNQYSYTDTPFGTVKREAEDPHLKDWQEIGWREEPTAIYPMLKWVNAHDDKTVGRFCQRNQRISINRGKSPSVSFNPLSKCRIFRTA